MGSLHAYLNYKTLTMSLFQSKLVSSGRTVFRSRSYSRVEFLSSKCSSCRRPRSAWDLSPQLSRNLTWRLVSKSRQMFHLSKCPCKPLKWFRTYIFIFCFFHFLIVLLVLDVECIFDVCKYLLLLLCADIISQGMVCLVQQLTVELLLLPSRSILERVFNLNN